MKDYAFQDDNIRIKTSNWNWIKTILYCMRCAQRIVWRAEDSYADYGGGDLHVCLNCGFQFYGWYGTEEDYCYHDIDKLKEKLRV